MKNINSKFCSIQTELTRIYLFSLVVSNSKMSKRGKTIPSSTREIIFNVIQFCQLEKTAQAPIIDLLKVTERAAAMTGICKNTISKIKKEGAQNNGVWMTPERKRAGRPRKAFDENAIRDKIREFYLVRKEVPTLRKLHRVLKEDLNFDGSVTTLRKILKELGYEYKESKSKIKTLTERESEQKSS